MQYYYGQGGEYLSFCILLLYCIYSVILNQKTIMRAQAYRQFQNQVAQPVQSNDLMNQLFDQRLYYLNRAFQENLKIQEIYLDITKSKKTIHAKELKDYYTLFTNSKAESLMFGHEVNQTQNVEISQSNKEVLFSLKRLYCRLIEKIMLKVSYYLMNKPSLNFAYACAGDLVKRCQTLMRRLNHLRDFNSMNEVIDKIFEQNEEFQKHILKELISHGYINSVDQFYRINGIDLDHRQVYERNEGASEDEEQQDPPNIQKKIKFKANFQTNLLVNNSFKKQIKTITEPIKTFNHRLGFIDNAAQRQIEAKYKDLIIGLDKLISSQSFEEIIQAKEYQEKDETGQIGEPTPAITPTPTPTPNNEQHQSQATSKNLPETSQQRIQELKPVIEHLTPKSIIRKKDLSKQSSQVSQQLQPKSQIHRQEITIQSLNSSSMIPDVATRGEVSRGYSRKHSSPFSRSFVNAIKSIEKINLIDPASRLTAKRMSEHIIEFHRQSQYKDALTSSQNSTMRERKSTVRILKKDTRTKSIVKLLNIYKNRTLQQFIGQAQKSIFESAQCLDKDEIKSVKTFKLSKRINENQKQNPSGFRLSERTVINIDSNNSQDYSLQKYSILHKAKDSQFKNQSSTKLKHLQHLKSQLTQNQLVHHGGKKKFATKTSIFQNFRLSQKISLNNLFQTLQATKNNSNNASPLQSTSILTSNGISSVDPVQYNLIREQAKKMNKTVQITPTQTPLFPNFEVYDRIRRVMINK